MDKNGQSRSGTDQALWLSMEGLLSPDPGLRESSLDDLVRIEGYYESPLVASILVGRILEPEIEIRHHIVQLLGGLLDFGDSGDVFSQPALTYAQSSLDQMGKDLLIKLLEVSERYLSSEPAIKAILRLSSYAGKGLSGIVNDRKQPLSLRQQAIFFCGEVGFLSSIPSLKNLVLRVEKTRGRPGDTSQRRTSRDEEFLYPFAKTALEKLKP